AEIESIVEPDHVLDGVDRDAALSDLAEDSRCIGVDAVKRRTVECGAEPFRPLMTTEEMETLVRVFRQHETGRQTRRLFRLLRLGCGTVARSVLAPVELRFRTMAILLVGAGLDFRIVELFQIHFAVRAIEERKLARQPVA